MAPLIDYSRLRNQNQFDSFGNVDDYGVTNPFQNTTFQGSGPRNPTQNTDYPIETQNSVFDRQSGGKEHPAVTNAMLRLKSIFDSYEPKTEASDRFNSMVQNTPQLNNPSIMRKLAALGTGLNVGPGFTRKEGGTDAMDRVLYAPYLQQMEEWKAKVGPAGIAAKNESDRNIQERTLLSNMMTNQTAQDRLDEQGRQADQKAEITRQRNAVLASKDLGFTYTKLGDDLIGHRPDGSTFPAGHASNFNDLELETLRQQGRMDVQGSRNEGAANVQGLRNQGNLDVQGSRNEGNLNVQGARNEGNLNVANARAGGAGKGMTPAQVTTNQLNQVQGILAYNPKLAKYITIQGRTITMNPPTDGMIFKADPQLKKDFDKARSVVFPSNPILSGVNPGTFGSSDTTQQKDPYTYGRSKSQPNEMTRTLNGKTEYSHDGGKNWGAQ